MIEKKEQDELFELISSRLKNDVKCFAFGGTALMYYGFKESTKDIDIIFEEEKDRDSFIEAITELGFKKRSMTGVYTEKKIKDKNTPLMFERGDARFDIFLKKIFNTELSERMIERSKEKHDFIRNKNTLTVFVISLEDIILLKSVTNRENDFADMEMILEKYDVDWEIIIDEAVKQKEKWTVLDLEEKMLRLKKRFYIPKKYFDILYKKA